MLVSNITQMDAHGQRALNRPVFQALTQDSQQFQWLFQDHNCAKCRGFTEFNTRWPCHRHQPEGLGEAIANLQTATLGMPKLRAIQGAKNSQTAGLIKCLGLIDPRLGL